MHGFVRSQDTLDKAVAGWQDDESPRRFGHWLGQIVCQFAHHESTNEYGVVLDSCSSCDFDGLLQGDSDRNSHAHGRCYFACYGQDFFGDRAPIYGLRDVVESLRVVDHRPDLKRNAPREE